MLLKAGADIDAVDSNGRNALKYAAQAGLPDRVQLLIGRGAKEAEANRSLQQAQDHALLNAVRTPYSTEIGKLLEEGANPNIRDSDGRTALMIGINSDVDPKSIALMLAKGADANAVDKDGNTALMIAGDQYQAATLALLLERGADVEGGRQRREHSSASCRGFGRELGRKAGCADSDASKREPRSMCGIRRVRRR